MALAHPCLWVRLSYWQLSPRSSEKRTCERHPHFPHSFLRDRLLAGLWRR
jgi:hypothetical protein